MAENVMHQIILSMAAPFDHANFPAPSPVITLPPNLKNSPNDEDFLSAIEFEENGTNRHR